MRIFCQLAGRCRIVACVFAVVVLAAGIPALTQRAEQAQSIGGSLPTLSGSKAIEHLKQNRQYDSLLEAFEATRKGQTDETPIEDAFGQTAKLTAADGAASDLLGWSVAISGETAIVGAWSDDVGANVDQGSAYIFVRSGSAWSQQQKLTASDGAVGHRFGWSVAISGETAIVGAYLGVGANGNQGSAYIFVRSGTAWNQQQKLTASDGAASDLFGLSVAISGETAIVGAFLDDVGANADQGSAYIFVRSGTAWSEQQKLTASDGAATDAFGESVAISGETAVVGAYQDRVGANSSQGSAYVFVRSGTVWSQQQKLTAADGEELDHFGSSVAISGETAIVAAYFQDEAGNVFEHSVYIFVRSGTMWSQQQKLTAADESFGYSVAISGETAIVGATTGSGSAYIFVRSGTMWSQQQQLTASDGGADDRFGCGVGISGETAIVGAWLDDVGANANQGSAYVYTPTAGFEGDVAPRNAGDGVVIATDVVQIRRFAAGLDTPDPGSNEFQRADSAPRATLGDGRIDATDVVQARRYATGLDPLTPAAGPAVAADQVGTQRKLRAPIKCIAGASTRASVITQPLASVWPLPTRLCARQ